MSNTQVIILLIGALQVALVTTLGLGDSIGFALPLGVKAGLVVVSATIAYVQAQLRGWHE